MVRHVAKGRARRSLLGLMVLAFGLSLVAILSIGGRPFLQLEYNLRSYLARHSKVAELHIPGIPGLKMFLHPDDSVITYRIMAERVWEANETHWVSKFVGEGDTFVDIGANVGYFTLVASRLVGDTGHVYAFEPDPIAFAILERNVRLNDLRNVTLEEKAVSNEPGTIQLFLAEHNKGDHRIYQTEENRPAIDVEAVTLDDYFEAYEGRIDFVKIDTQGAEGVILQGMGDLVRSNDGIVLAVEYWPHGLRSLGVEPRDFLALLRSHDFRMFDLGLGPEGVQPLRELYDEPLLQRFTDKNWEMFTNLFLLKGYKAASQLGLQELGKAMALEMDTSRLRVAQQEWEAEVLAKLNSDGLDDSPVPTHVARTLLKPPDQRTLEEAVSLQRYFRSVTPLLAEAREEFKEARQAVNDLRERTLKDRMRR